MIKIPGWKNPHKAANKAGIYYLLYLAFPSVNAENISNKPEVIDYINENNKDINKSTNKK